MKTHSLLMPLLLLVPQFGNGQGTLVFNGGFDSGSSGWTLTNGAAWAGPLKGNPGGFVDLDSLSPSLSTDPTISQSINGLASGNTYAVSGDFEKTLDRSGGTITGLSFGVAMDGNYLFTTADPGNFNWHSFSFFYVASASSAVLSLSSQLNGTQVSYGIDNIWIQVVPEPSSFALCLTGGIIAVRRFIRRRKNMTAPAERQSKLPLALIAIASIMLIPTRPVVAQGSLVVNGSFSVDAAGWTLSNGASHSPGLVVLDSISPSLATDPTANQLITGLIPGQIYSVSGIYGASKVRGGGSPSDLSFGVALDGSFLFQSTLPATSGFHDFSFLFSAASSTALLSLSGQMNGSGQSYAIDDIIIAVPEPSALALCLTGGIISASRFVRRRKT